MGLEMANYTFQLVVELFEMASFAHWFSFAFFNSPFFKRFDNSERKKNRMDFEYFIRETPAVFTFTKSFHSCKTIDIRLNIDIYLKKRNLWEKKLF